MKNKKRMKNCSVFLKLLIFFCANFKIRFVLEGLNKEQLTSILENNGYSYKGKDDFLIRQIMTKISYSVIIEELEAMGVI